MNRSEHLLCCLAEECTEIGQRVSKALRFGLDEIQPGQPLTNGERIAQEVCDFIAVLDMLEREEILPRGTDWPAALGAKKAKVEKFMRYAAEVGALQPDPTP